MTPPSESPAPPLLDSGLEWLGRLVARVRRATRRDVSVLVVGAGVGVGVALALPSQYTSSATFIAQGSGTPLIPSALAGLAATVGFSGTRDFSPQFYADLAMSRPVLLAALDSQYVVMRDGRTITESYAQIEKISQTDSAKVIDLELQALGKRVSAHADVRTNIISLYVTARMPTLSRDIASNILGALNALNVRFRQEQSRELALFYESRVATAQAALDSAETALRVFSERNRAIQNSPLLTMEETRLTRLADAKRTLYTSVAQQYEETRAQEARDVPVLTILSAPTVPVKKSAPPRRLIVVLGIVAAILLLALETRLREVWTIVVRTSSTAKH